ncbi:MAG: AAA domain-containing protein, partial [Alphaproteobacteria bacterium]
RDVESILGLCNARGLPSAMLRWHYRSRHESLIATSNAEFYDNRLFILPSPRARSAALGLSLRRVEGRFDTGGTGTNAEEARAVAEAVMAHARETPGDTLGVAAFSIRQRDAILNAVEAARRDNPDTEAFFTSHPDEPFFVKNLENVQGDERDSIMISVGYGRGADGKLAMRFGPLSADGGERRLNVLITRAKKRCMVFSSIGADDIDLARASGRGVATLKTFLAFAAAGDGARATAAKTQAAPLAAAIGKAIQSAGKEAVPRVGMAGLFLDVAARDSGNYVLGIEADAGDWAALRCARDRERGRDSALQAMGWKLARAWSLSWYGRPEAEAARIAALLGAAPAASAVESTAPTPETGLAEAYREAVPEVPKDTTIADVPFATLAGLLAEIIAVESPITNESLGERVRLLWGLDALPTPARDALRQALALARQLHGVKEEQGFLLAEGAAIAPRDRRAASAHLRRAAAVAPREIAAAAEKLLALRPATTEAELAAGIHRLLGLDANAAPAVAARLAGLIGAGVVKL